MEKFIDIRFGELFLKKKNKDDFKKALFVNIKKVLSSFFVSLVDKYDKFWLKFDAKYTNEIVQHLKLIPGIHHFYLCNVCDTDIAALKQTCTNLIADNKTFKIEVKRKDKSFLSREIIIKEVAKHIFANFNVKVDVNNPEIKLNIVIDSPTLSYVWTNKIMGIGGLPVGVNGKCLALISGGIDSPVAAFLLQRKGMQVDYLNFITDVVSKPTINKIKNLIKKITLNHKIYQPLFHVVDFSQIQHELIHTSNQKYKITLMRRSFYRIALQIAQEYGYDCIACGDSLGQVASQTLESIQVISQVCDSIPIFRPLLTYDKSEIISLAKKIDTYELSIQDHEDVCGLFAPKNPITKPKLNVVQFLENELELLKSLENNVVNKHHFVTKRVVCLISHK
ncbi:MAG: tRNA 4-thiouridine(8) synthase ThiI [Malacoplasma sp.]|nr:tRNA 4-thiouridine(8) synthase ThiI [Malacoplasma sp.]